MLQIVPGTTPHLSASTLDEIDDVFAKSACFFVNFARACLSPRVERSFVI
jgi:hypothetical protein